MGLFYRTKMYINIIIWEIANVYLVFCPSPHTEFEHVSHIAHRNGAFLAQASDFHTWFGFHACEERPGFTFAVQ